MKILLFALPLILAFEISKAECPPKEDIPDCLCRSSRYTKVLRVFCRNIRDYHTLYTQIRKFQNETLAPLSIHNVTIDCLTYDIFNNISIVSLAISNVTMDSIGPKDFSGKSPFDGSQDVMTYFSLGRRSKVNVFDWNHFSKMKRLYTIRISGSNITSIPGWTRVSRLNFTNFIMSDTTMTTLGVKTFAKHKDLMSLSVPRNHILTVNRDMFPKPANKLRVLIFTSNLLAYLPMDFFSEMPALNFVDFKQNEFMTLSEEIVLPVWHQLRGFMFEGNPIHCDYNFLWVMRNRERHEGQPRYTDLLRVKCDSPPKLKGKTISVLTDSDLEMDNGLDK